MPLKWSLDTLQILYHEIPYGETHSRYSMSGLIVSQHAPPTRTKSRFRMDVQKYVEINQTTARVGVQGVTYELRVKVMNLQRTMARTMKRHPGDRLRAVLPARKYHGPLQKPDAPLIAIKMVKGKCLLGKRQFYQRVSDNKIAAYASMLHAFTPGRTRKLS